VLQFGAEAEVLKPASLRREVVGELERAMGVYEDISNSKET
jgi:predicted DNA-binding transcriptional regulator YafY